MTSPSSFRWIRQLRALDDRYEVSSDGRRHTVTLASTSITLMQISPETMTSNVDTPNEIQSMMVSHFKQVGMKPSGAFPSMRFKIRPLKSQVKMAA
ncbi:hypothetical protein RYA05_04475 [Pseudomonas syringae pv. actinidiae]|nr:hypothetical protein [Pseudomonas syringae pv. actinidiae]